MRTERDIDGDWHYLERQQVADSCGPACVKIVCKLVNNRDLGEQYVRMVIAQYEGHNDGNLGTGGVLVEGARNFLAGGTWNVRAGLDALRPPIQYETYSGGEQVPELPPSSEEMLHLQRFCGQPGEILQ